MRETNGEKLQVHQKAGKLRILSQFVGKSLPSVYSSETNAPSVFADVLERCKHGMAVNHAAASARSA